MLLFIPMIVYLTKKAKQIRITKFKIQDKRIKMINEILTGIRVIKFFGWELSFQNMVTKIRAKEIVILIKSSIVFAVTNLNWGYYFS